MSIMKELSKALLVALIVYGSMVAGEMGILTIIQQEPILGIEQQMIFAVSVIMVTQFAILYNIERLIEQNN